MKRFLKWLALLLAMGACFLLGWRVMPKVWPAIKTKVVYRLLPQLQPTPRPQVTPAPYVPSASAALGDPIHAADSVIYYFYKDNCPYCAQLDPLIAALPSRIYLADGRESQVKMICLNKGDEETAPMIAAYYEKYAISEERQYVPAMVIGDRYMMPGSEIIDQLMDALIAGEGLQTPLMDGSTRSP